MGQQTGWLEGKISSFIFRFPSIFAHALQRREVFSEGRYNFGVIFSWRYILFGAIVDRPRFTISLLGATECQNGSHIVKYAPIFKSLISA